MDSAIFLKLNKSKFRSKFKLDNKMKDYIHEKKIDIIKEHAKDIIRKRIAPKVIPNDGKQTPFKGHPVFIAQHATATCCRQCINKWHKFNLNSELTLAQQDYIVGLILVWIQKNIS
jgi:hypothetical protein